MFTSTTDVKTLLDETISEMGLYEEIPRSTYRRVLNETIGRLYGELVREEREVLCSPDVDGAVPISSMSMPSDNAPLREEDILGIHKGSQVIHYLPPSRFHLVASEDGNFYTVKDQSIRFTPPFTGHGMRIIYLCHPKPYSESDEERMLPIPDEYLSLLRAKLRGEIFKLANEDSLAAKWLGEYNAALPAFAAYCERARRERVG